MVRVDTFEEARRIREANFQKVSLARKLSDAAATFYLWHRNYFGIEPRTMVQHLIYQRRLEHASRTRGS